MIEVPSELHPGSINDAFSDDQRKLLAMTYADSSGFPDFNLPGELPEVARDPKNRGVLFRMGRTVLAVSFWTTVFTAGAHMLKDEFSALTTHEQTVDLTRLPPDLPKPVQQRIASVGRVLNSIYDYSSISDGLEGPKTAWAGSGVEIAPNIALTAGHMLLSGGEKPLVNRSRQCNVVQFDRLNGSLADEQDGVQASATYVYGDNTKTPDLALIRTTDPWIAASTPMKLHSSNLTVGEPLFFANYQPTAANVYRDPVARGTSKDYYSYPAIYGGIYVGNESNGDIMTVTGLKSYGVISDSFSRKGSSGGAVFDSSGNLVGLSIQSSISSSSVTSYDSYFHDHLSGVNNNRMVEETIVQPVNQAEINHLITEAKPIPECFPN